MGNYKEIKGKPDRIFAIGDVHGCALELHVMLNYLSYEIKLTDNDHVVFIGDYIDRGPASQAVVEDLIDFSKSHPATTFLKGNHEDMLLDFLGLRGSNGSAFLQNGGFEFLKSYGLSADMTNEKILKKIPQKHINFFQTLHDFVFDGNFLFVHAGVNPHKELNEQSTDDLFWIRELFIRNPHKCDKQVVFGHTPFQELYFDLPTKIGIDTGLVFGNMLTCVEVKSEQTYQIMAGDTLVIASDYENKGARSKKAHPAMMQV